MHLLTSKSVASPSLSNLGSRRKESDGDLPSLKHVLYSLPRRCQLKITTVSVEFLRCNTLR
jgi:hypothetical protein